MHVENYARNQNQQTYCDEIAISYWNLLLKILK